MWPLGGWLRCAAGRHVRLPVLLRLGVPLLLLLLLLLLRVLLLLLHCACRRPLSSSLWAPAAQTIHALTRNEDIAAWVG